MKIITAEKAYVQKKDIEVLFASYDGETPETILRKQLFNALFFWDGNRFVEFTDPIEIEFFKNLSWSVNYLTLKDLSEEELLELSRLVEEEKKALEKEYNDKGIRKNKYDSIIKRKLEILDFKQNSIIDVLEIGKGELKIQLPSEVADDFYQVLEPVDKPKVKRYLNLPIRTKKD